jgi:hypothetical protein
MDIPAAKPMETSRLIIAFAVVCLMTVAAVFLLPWLVTKLTQRGWRRVKFFLLFAALAAVLGLLLPVFISVPLAFTIAFIHYKNSGDRV